MAYYVIGEGNNFYESMTKEQILAAITQAVETHTITDVDTGFVTTIKENNKNKPLALWVGSEAEYNAIETKDANTLYIKTDDSTLEAIAEQLNEYNNRLNALAEIIDNFNYKIDEIGSIVWYGAGYITAGSTKIHFSVPLPKTMPSGLTVDLRLHLPYPDLPFLLTARQNNNYLYGSASSAGSFDKENITVEVLNNTLHLDLNYPDGYTNAINNDSVGINVQFSFWVVEET